MSRATSSLVLAHNSLPTSAGEPLKTKEDIRIAFVGTLVPDEPFFRNPAFSWGGHIFQKGMALGLSELGCTPFIISSAPIPSYPKDRKIWVNGRSTRLPEGPAIKVLPTINVTPIKQLFVGLNSMLEIAKWGWKNRDAHHRVVYTYNLSMPPCLFTLLGARLARAKAVAWICDINLPGGFVPSTTPFRIDYWLQKRLIPHFDGHLVVTDGIAREFLPGKPYLRLEGGLAMDVLEQTVNSSARADRPAKPFVITYTGALDTQRGILNLLEAFSVLSGPEYHLRIAGSGPLEGTVIDAAAKDFRIEFVGPSSFSETLALYNSTDVLVNLWSTSVQYSEHFFPGKLMAYLASGVPVISTNTGNIKEEFGDFVYLLPDESPAAIAAMIRSVAAMPQQERRKKALAARAYVQANKTWNVQAKRMLNYIQQSVLNTERN
jgi:glycosyltransferase involved in cell wall biosynthesis